MLDSIRQFFDRNFASPGADRDEHTIELATAALLLEVSRADGAISAGERDATARALRSKFHLLPEEATTLIELAEAEVREATDTFQFTSLVNKQFSRDQKIRVVELMWQVAYADGGRDVFEDHMIRKLADLLYVDHGDYIAAKLKARDAGKSGTDPI
jgi:uncharacterized tellurite resistance protein B-like protein